MKAFVSMYENSAVLPYRDIHSYMADGIKRIFREMLASKAFHL
jgi:hypothetical protein